MGKGLSDLQRGILRIAYTNRTRPPADAELRRRRLMDVYKNEVILKLYMGRTGAISHYDWHGYLQTYIDALSPAEYRSAQAAVARAFKRLEERGLIVRDWRIGGTGGSLTHEGAKVASRL